MFKLLHGQVHQDEQIIKLLQQHTFYFIPALNLDGVTDVSNPWMKFGRFIYKRKNVNPSYGGFKKCGDDETAVGVDLNRNWGFGFW